MNEIILVVDDSALSIKFLTNILEEEKFNVYSLQSGLQVLNKVIEIMPDVIMLDIIMPGMDGFEICKLLKSNLDIADIPVIMATASTNSIDIKRALEIGAFDYIKKPFDQIEVIARLRSAIRFKRILNMLSDMAMKDGLTGLYNHTLLIELFNGELSKQERTNDTIAFVMLDIDFFKKVNDTYGHATGDIILKELAKILKDSMRIGDIVGRYGGEEFGLVLLSIDRQNVLNLCNRLRRDVEEFSFNNEDIPIRITISIGIYFKEFNDTTSGQEMIRKADDALYRAKKNGRNRVEFFL